MTNLVWVSVRFGLAKIVLINKFAKKKKKWPEYGFWMFVRVQTMPNINVRWKFLIPSVIYFQPSLQQKEKVEIFPVFLNRYGKL